MAVAFVRPSRVGAFAGSAVALLAGGWRGAAAAAGEARKPDGERRHGRRAGAERDVGTGRAASRSAGRHRRARQAGEAAGRAVHDAVRVRLRVSAWRASAATKRATRPASPARTRAPRGPACRRSRGPIPAIAARPRRRRPAGPPASATAPARASASAATPGVVCAAEACVGFMRTTTGTCDSDGQLLGRDDAAVHAVPVRARRQDLPHDLHVGRRLRRAQQLRQRAAAARSRSAPPAATTTSATRRSARRAGAARPPAPGRASRARSRAARGPAATSPTARICTASAPTGPPPPAGWTGMCDGMGACRKYAVSTVCGTDSCSMGAERVAGRCDAAGTCAPGHAALVQPVRVRDDELPDQLRDHRRLRDRVQLRRQRLRAEGERHGLHRRRASASRATASRASAATPAAPPPARRCNLTGHRRDLLADRRRDGAHAGHASARTWGRHVVRHRRQVQRRRRLPQLRRQHRTVAPRAARARRCRRREPATAPGVCRAATTSSCTPYHLRHRRLQDDLHDRGGRLHVAATPASTMSCGKIPIGGSCPSGVNSDCASNFCVNNVCCNIGLHGHLHVVLADGQRRDVLADRAGRSAAGRVAVPGGRGVDVRQRRHLQRRRGVPQARQRHAVRGARCASNATTACRRASATAPGSAAPRRPTPVREVHLRHDGGRVPHQLHDRDATRLRGAQHLQRQHLHAQADRHGVHDGGRVRLRLLRAGVLLQPGVHGDVQVVRDRRQRRDLQQRRQRNRADAGHASARRPRRRRCGLDGMCNGAGACRFWASGHAVRRGDLRRIDADAAAHLRRRRRLPVGDQLAVRSVPVRVGAPRARRPAPPPRRTACRRTAASA